MSVAPDKRQRAAQTEVAARIEARLVIGTLRAKIAAWQATASRLTAMKEQSVRRGRPDHEWRRKAEALSSVIHEEEDALASMIASLPAAVAAAGPITDTRRAIASVRSRLGRLNSPP